MLNTDCTTPAPFGGGFVWWNNISNQWEFTLNLGDNTDNFYNYNSNPGLLPLSDITYPWVDVEPNIALVSSTLGNCCICVKLEYIDASTYGGTYLDCNNDIQNWTIPEAGDSYTYLCTSNLASITWNTQPDFFILNGECINNQCLIPTPTPTPTITPTNTPTPTITPTPTLTPTSGMATNPLSGTWDLDSVNANVEITSINNLNGGPVSCVNATLCGFPIVSSGGQYVATPPTSDGVTPINTSTTATLTLNLSWISVIPGATYWFSINVTGQSLVTQFVTYGVSPVTLNISGLTTGSENVNILFTGTF
jgi:hypothetical protein